MSCVNTIREDTNDEDFSTIPLLRNQREGQSAASPSVSRQNGVQLKSHSNGLQLAVQEDMPMVLTALSLFYHSATGIHQRHSWAIYRGLFLTMPKLIKPRLKVLKM